MSDYLSDLRKVFNEVDEARKRSVQQLRITDEATRGWVNVQPIEDRPTETEAVMHPEDWKPVKENLKVIAGRDLRPENARVYGIPIVIDYEEDTDD